MSRHLSPLFLVGALVVLAGAAGSLADHASMPAGAVWLCSLLGQGQTVAQEVSAVGVALDHTGHDGTRAHVVVLVGMLITTADLVRRGVRWDGG